MAVQPAVGLALAVQPRLPAFVLRVGVKFTKGLPNCPLFPEGGCKAQALPIHLDKVVLGSPGLLPQGGKAKALKPGVKRYGVARAKQHGNGVLQPRAELTNGVSPDLGIDPEGHRRLNINNSRICENNRHLALRGGTTRPRLLN